MLARARAGCVVGVEARDVDVEVYAVKAIPEFQIVGLPETAVRESRVRVRAAIKSSGFELPPRSIVLNLAPADQKKRGATLDLAIAIAILAASGGCAPNRLEETLLFGELSLSGELRPGRGLLPLLRSARARGLTAAIVPRAQLEEASLVSGIEVRGAATLTDVVDWLGGGLELPRSRATGVRIDAACGAVDLSEVQGQESAKRALEIAAAGRHHVLLIGPPGAGKTMLARRLPGILPAPSTDEALEIATIASAAGFSRAGAPIQRPFRAPHHTASAVALVGGGDPVSPGEVTLAHRGVLFLDELPEFSRPAVESFRTVMESGIAVVARAKERVSMPAEPLVVAAMNPCPCGYAGDPTRLCTCSPSRADSYRARVSGPILDRFDLHVALPPVRLSTLAETKGGEPSAIVRARVERARARLGSTIDRERPIAEEIAALPTASRRVAIDAAQALGLSMRGLRRALRVARTIAALEEREHASPEHVAEAISYRLLDRAEDAMRRRARSA